MKKLYGCKRCNKIGYTDPCICSGVVYEFKTIGVDEVKASIGNEDVFDRIDRELTSLRSYNAGITRVQEELTNRIESLEKDLTSINSVFRDQIETLKYNISCINKDLNKLESKEKIQFEKEEEQNHYLGSYDKYVEGLERIRGKYATVISFLQGLSNAQNIPQADSARRLLKELGE